MSTSPAAEIVSTGDPAGYNAAVAMVSSGSSESGTIANSQPSDASPFQSTNPASHAPKCGTPPTQTAVAFAKAPETSFPTTPQLCTSFDTLIVTVHLSVIVPSLP